MTAKTASSTQSSTSNGNADADVDTAVAEIELPCQNAEEDLRYQLIDEYQKCLGRHDVTLTDLMRLHEQQEKSSTKLTVNLLQLKDQERKERKKADEYEQLLTDIAKDVNDLQGLRRPIPQRRQPAGLGELRDMVDNLKKQAGDLKKRKEEVEKMCAEAKAKEWEADEKKRKELDEQKRKLSQDLEAINSEIREILQSMNCSIAQLNQCIKTTYSVPQEPKSTNDVRNVLNMILFDVSNMIDGKRRLDEDNERLSRKIEQLNTKIEETGQKLRMLEGEVGKLLAIGCRPEAANVDRENYGQVTKFVEETFDILTIGLQDRSGEVDKEGNRLAAIEAENEKLKKDNTKAMDERRTKIDELKRQVDGLKFQNEMLRNELRRSARCGTVQDNRQVEADGMMKKVETLANAQMAAEGQELDTLRNQLLRARGKNEEALGELEKVANEMDDLDEKLSEKRRELDELRRRCERRKMDNARKNERFDEQIAELQREIERLKAELDKASRDSAESCGKGGPRTEGKVANALEERVKQAESERAALASALKQMKDRHGKSCQEANKIRDRRRDKEEELDECLEKIAELERKLQRQREFLVYQARQPIVLKQTDVIRFNTGVPSASDGRESRKRSPSTSDPSQRQKPDEAAENEGSGLNVRIESEANLQSNADSRVSQATNYSEQIESLQQSKRLAVARLDALLAKIQRCRSRGSSADSQCSENQGQPSDQSLSTQTPVYESDSTKGTSTASQKSEEKFNGQRSVEEIRSARCREQSAVQMQISPKGQAEKRQNDCKDPDVYDVTADIVLTFGPSTETGSTSATTTADAGIRSREPVGGGRVSKTICRDVHAKQNSRRIKSSKGSQKSQRKSAKSKRQLSKGKQGDE